MRWRRYGRRPNSKSRAAGLRSGPNIDDAGGISRSAVELQQNIWGFADVELLPVRLFVVATQGRRPSVRRLRRRPHGRLLLAIPGLKHEGEASPQLSAQPHAGRAAGVRAIAGSAGC